MLAAKAHVLLLGVTYTSSTSHHFCEWLCNVPYAKPVSRRQVRKLSGIVEAMTFVDYQPKPIVMVATTDHAQLTSTGSGRCWRCKGRSVWDDRQRRSEKVGVTRFVRSRRIEAEKDYNVFRTAEDARDKARHFGMERLSFTRARIWPADCQETMVCPRFLRSHLTRETLGKGDGRLPALAPFLFGATRLIPVL